MVFDSVNMVKIVNILGIIVLCRHTNKEYTPTCNKHTEQGDPQKTDYYRYKIKTRCMLGSREFLEASRKNFVKL